MATVDETHKIYTDQTRKFPMTSSQSKKYAILCIYMMLPPFWKNLSIVVLEDTY